MNRGCLNIVLLMALVIFAAGCHSNDGLEHVTIDGHEFALEYADTEEARTKGLGGHAPLAENGGMIFIFPDADFRRFWMKDCTFDIDIMFLDSMGRITAMHHMPMEPPRGEFESEFAYEDRLPGYPSELRARFAIELQAGWLERLDLKVRDRIDLDLDRLKRRAK